MKKKILILSNHFITLYNFRKELIHRLVEEGHEVILSMPSSGENQYFINLGCRVIETEVDRRGLNPIKDMKLILNYIKIMKKINPDIIFSYTIKPNIYGSLASNITRYRQVNNITGTGATFLNDNLVSKVARVLYKVSIKHSYKVFFQNSGDRDYFVKNKMVKENYELLPGSGVNLEQYQFTELPKTDIINFIFIGRVMKVKGIEEYLECAKVIKEENMNVNFYIAGFIEEKQYKGIIEEYHNKGIINYIGFQKDIKSWIQKSHCTVLPSHGGEGVPNVILESAAIGRPAIVSNINGSTDVIENNITGYVFKKKDSKSLINQVNKFISLDIKRRKKMAMESRKKVEKYFNRQLIIQKYLDELD